ncbi:MAG: hypothetical protein ACK4L4_20125, partial [Gemmobacter sp.]
MELFDFSETQQKIISWMLGSGLKILAIVLIAYFLNFFFQKVIKKSILAGIKDGIKEEEKKKRIETLIKVFGGTLRLIIWIVAILMI